MSLRVTVQIAMELWGAVFCLIFAVLIGIGGDRSRRRSMALTAILLQLALLLVSDSTAWLSRGRLGEAAFWAVRISNYLVFVLSFSLGLTSLIYLDAILMDEGRRVSKANRHLITAVCLTGIIMVTVSQFTGFLYTIGPDNLYVRGEGYRTIGAAAGLMLLLLILCILYYARRTRDLNILSLLTMYLLTLAADGIQLLFYGISVANLAMAAGVVLMFFAYEQTRIRQAAEREKQLLENELRLVQQQSELLRKDAENAALNAELVEKKTQIMLSQIQPHFLFNALSAISYLCVKDPPRARQTLAEFSDYIRMNLDSLKGDRLVSFQEELRHTRIYLGIEQLRFGEDLKLCYDIRCEDFCLPALTLQPIVENAVRHGICSREDGGTVTIRTEELPGGFRITVADDGEGFDPAAAPRDGQSHVGLENVRQRIQVLSGGSLTLTSTPGGGTVVTMFFPG